MFPTSPFAPSPHYHPAEMALFQGVTLPARFAALDAEYRAARDAAVVFDRSDRGLLIASGPDRKTWLHNLITNTVKMLDDHAGNYAFATDLKGRVQFDLNVLVLPDAIWLDIDSETAPKAKTHLERYLITEKVDLRDATGEYARLACAGPAAAHVAAALGVSNLTPMAALSSTWLPAQRERPGDTGSSSAAPSARLVRHDFIGLPGFELIVPRPDATAWWDRLIIDCRVQPAGVNTFEVLRIEAGIPRWGADIDDKTIAPETGQIERAISYSKGCYLGQEIIERMRSLGAPARRLVRLSIDDGTGLALPTTLVHNGADAGRITSLIKHPTQPVWIGLGYLKSSVPPIADLTVGDPARPVRILG